MIDSRAQTKITSHGSAANPNSVPRLSRDQQAPALSSRPWFFSLLPSADVKRTEISLNAAQRRVTGFIRFITDRSLPAKDVKTAADASQEHLAAAKASTVEEVKKRISSSSDINRVDDRGMSATMYAAQRGDIDMLKALVTAGSNINLVNGEGQDALILAVKNGHADIIEYLLSQGADLTRPDKTGCTAFVLAARAGKTDVIQSFINAGVDIDAPADNGCTPLMCAAENGHVEFVKQLIANGADANKINMKHKMTAMMYAAQRGDIDMLKALVTAGSNINLVNGEGQDALILAVKNGHADIIEYLLSQGADLTRPDKTGCTAFVLAARAGKTDVIQSFINAGVDIDAPADNGCTLLMCAAENGHVEFVKQLIANGADANKINMKHKMTAMMYAAQKGLTEVVKLLLLNKVNLDIKASEGSNALMLAARHGQTAVVELLLEHGASADEESTTGQNALIFAAEHGHYSTVTSLIEGGANQDKALLAILKHNRQNITIPIVRAWLNSKTNKFDVLKAINCCGLEPLTTFPDGTYFVVQSLDALAEGGLTLTKGQLVTLKTTQRLGSNILKKLKECFVDGHISKEGKIRNAYWSGNHAVVDAVINAPEKTKSNPLGLRRKKGFNPDHITREDGRYLHAVGQLRDQSPELYFHWKKDSMLSKGWRSKITTLVGNARNEAATATREISAFLAHSNLGCTLTDQFGSPVPATNIRLKDTLFAFELERNEGLKQIIEPPVDSLFDKLMAWAKGLHEQTTKAQAEAILASNKTYSRLKLNMPALAKAGNIEKQVIAGCMTSAEAVNELDKLFSETQQLFLDAPGIESDLAGPWFRFEVGEVCEKLEKIRTKFKKMDTVS